jgi:hypothetical protein
LLVGAESDWLDPAISKEHALSMLEPYPAELMLALPASTRVNSVRNDDSGTGRRRLLGVVVVALFALVAAGVSQGGATPSTAKSTVYNDRDDCTYDPANRAIGTATFTRNKNTLTVKVSLRDAEPGTYTIYLYQFTGGTCGDYFTVGTFKVGASGEGSRVGSADVSGEGSFFFVDVYNNTNGTDNESDVVKV